MAAVLPAKLKTADVQRFATRAAQLVKFKPIVTYWCEYYILQQILAKQLHAVDEECSNYALQLMDKLEAFKAENAANDAVVDDVAAKIYIENFALETFDRADESQRSNKVSRQTADTFSAASVFLDLLGIWGPLEPEFASKSKFAKFHALRISRAIKANEDPNATNPVIEVPETPTVPQPNDVSEAELRDLEKPDDGGVYQPPTVESVPDSALPNRPNSTSQNGNTSSPNFVAHPLERGNADLVLDSTEHQGLPGGIVEETNSRAGSIGGGYFPSVPESGSALGPTAPVDPTLPTNLTSTASPSPADFYHANQSPIVPLSTAPGVSAPDRPSRPTPHQMMAEPPAIPPPAPTSSQPVHAAPPIGGYRMDDESIMAAQKHAKWAISALNFEDVNTAVKELRIALQNLGAS